MTKRDRPAVRSKRSTKEIKYTEYKHKLIFTFPNTTLICFHQLAFQPATHILISYALTTRGYCHGDKTSCLSVTIFFMSKPQSPGNHYHKLQSSQSGQPSFSLHYSQGHYMVNNFKEYSLKRKSDSGQKEIIKHFHWTSNMLSLKIQLKTLIAVFINFI